MRKICHGDLIIVDSSAFTCHYFVISGPHTGSPHDMYDVYTAILTKEAPEGDDGKVFTIFERVIALSLIEPKTFAVKLHARFTGEQVR